jgi:hypothetical protein
VKSSRKGHSEHDFLTWMRVALIAAVSWFLLTTVGELIGNQANDTAFGRTVGHYVLLAAAVLVPFALLLWLVLYLRDRRHEPPEPAEEIDRRPPLEPPSWRRPDPLYGRDSEVGKATESLLSNGIVAVIGPRDVGTSAVAEAVVQRLIDENDADAGRVVRFDLRSRSSRRPDDPRAAAGRIVSALGLDEPADDTATLLAGAGNRMVAAAQERYDVLMLDNVSTQDEVEWLVRQWPSDGPPWLVVAGESAIGSLVEHSTVFVGELDLPGLKEMWEAELPESSPGLREWIRGVRKGKPPPDLNSLLRACFGRPRALKAFVEEIKRSETVTIESLLAAVNSAGPIDGPIDGPLERVWTAILDHVRDGLTPDAVWLLHALAELPVTGLTRNAIAAMCTTVGEPLEELRIRNLVQESGGRYRLPSEVRRAVTGTTHEDTRLPYALEAVPALLAYYAQQATRWAARLGTGTAVADWFHDAERTLRPLFNKDSYLDEGLLALSIEDLAGIADALEAWYVREQQPGGLLEVNKNLRTLAERANRPDLVGIAALRMATAHRIARRLGDANAMLDVAAAYPSGELEIREHIERALLCMAGSTHAGPDPEGMARAETELCRLLDTRPQYPGTTIALINLGALCLQQQRPADALTYLRRAEKLATAGHDTGARAHTLELQGVALSSEDVPAAVRLWWRAEELFTLVAEEQGEARCLQHLGSAALTNPTVAGQIRDGRPTDLTPREAAAVALPLLERSKRLRAGQPDTTLVDHYLHLARTRLEPPDPHRADPAAVPGHLSTDPALVHSHPQTKHPRRFRW